MVTSLFFFKMLLRQFLW